MIYLIFYRLLGINIFKYITFRTIYASITSMLIGFIAFPYFEKRLKNLQFEQKLKGFLPENHRKKVHIPTMGGLFIIFDIMVTSILWNRLNDWFIILSIVTILAFGILGFVDDYIKVKRRAEGLSEKQKFISQLIIATAVVIVLFINNFSTELYFPIFKNLHVNLGYFFIPWAVFVIVGASNAVNLTDGLDGLAIGPVITTSLVFMAFSYIEGNAKLSSYLNLPHLQGVGELTVLCAIVIGASLTFLWFNTYPAQIFMGDVGSLSLGAFLGLISVLTKQEFVLAIAGGIFVLETVSVIIQRFYFKYTRKKFGKGIRIFRMAPIHHHFEELGWEEPKITVRFWIISIILALVALSLIKIR